MFLNNPSALATRTPRHLHSNNENANTTLRSKIASDSNGTLATKTPKTKDLGTQQRRRRALGDISNRKNGLGNSSFSVKQQQSSVVKPKVNFATPAKRGLKSNTSFKSQPEIRIDPIRETKNKSVVKHDYDSVLGRTTRWSTDHDEEDRSPFDFMSKEELFMVDTVRDEIDAKQKKRQMEEQKRMEVAYEKQLEKAKGCWDAGLENVDLDSGCVEDDSSLVVKCDEWSEDGDESDLLSLLDDLGL